MRAAWAIAISLLLIGGAAGAKEGKGGGGDDDRHDDEDDASVDGGEQEPAAEGGTFLGDAFDLAPELAQAPDLVASEPPAEGDAGEVPVSPGSESIDFGGDDDALFEIRAPAAIGKSSPLAAVAALALVGAALLGGAAWLARRSRRPLAPKPPRKTFEHGRRLGRQAGARDETSARAALQAAAVGKIAQLAVRPHEVDAVLERRKGQPCPQAVGFLTGLYESAWADEVRVEHPSCAGEGGGACRYIVRRVRGAAIGSGSPAEGGPIPGSAAARRRSPPARSDGD